MYEKKRIVNLQILDTVVSLKISDKNEDIVRYAAKKLNDRRSHCVKTQTSLKPSYNRDYVLFMYII